MRPLTEIEARVLATLMEKARTVPDSYPLSLNALVAGCNQKSSREPVMNVSEAEAQEALDSLKQLTLVFATSGSRVARWEHNFQRGIGVPEQSAVLLGLLMLRGPQTLGELRDRTERMHRFEDLEQVERSLRVLGEWNGQQLVKQLPRHPCSKEPRWLQLLGGEPSSADLEGPSATRSDRLSALETEVRVLQDELAALKAEFESFRRQF